MEAVGPTAEAKPSLVFIGFMAAGKSKAARAAGDYLGVEPLDADVELERALAMPIGEFFNAHGEQEFRRREAELVVAMLDRAGGAPVALGGGSVLSEAVAGALRDHVVVWLDVAAEEAWGRVDGTERPLARDNGEFQRLHAERAPVYASLADAVVPGRRDTVRAALPALAALLDAPAGTRMLWASSASGDYPVFIGSDLLGLAVLAPINGRNFLVTDQNVGARYGDRVRSFARVELPPGEASKQMDSVRRVWAEMVTNSVTRRDCVLALGGGVIGDVAGFCAATYMRGVAYVQVPTTLVAQVDSAYGGKTGVDLPEAKNYVGAYHQPAAVVADLDTLRTLPSEELAAGFVEVVKTGLLAGGELWERVRALDALSAEAVAPLVEPCVRYKLDVVAADERDDGLRRVLNLGHTVGHAIEAASGYSRYRHGEAVGLGLLAALRISGADGLREEVRALLTRHDLPVSTDAGVGTEEILEALQRDKKRTERGVEFVLLTEPGRPRPGEAVDPASVKAAVEELVS